MSPIVLIILVILAVALFSGGFGYHTGYFGGTPNYSYGYGGFGLGGLIVLILVVLFLTGRL